MHQSPSNGLSLPDSNFLDFVSILEEAYPTKVDIVTRSRFWRAAGDHIFMAINMHAA